MFKIFNQRLAGWLMLHGHQLRSIEPNTKKNGFTVFSFDSNNAVSKSIDEYQNTNKPKNKLTEREQRQR